MELTLDYIKTNFDKFNEKYFDGCLVTPKFKIVHTKSYLGGSHGRLSTVESQTIRFQYLECLTDQTRISATLSYTK